MLNTHTCTKHTQMHVLQGLQTKPSVKHAAARLRMYRVSQNHKYTVYIRYFWQENHQKYGHIRCIYTVLANPTHVKIAIIIGVVLDLWHLQKNPWNGKREK